MSCRILLDVCHCLGTRGGSEQRSRSVLTRAHKPTPFVRQLAFYSWAKRDFVRTNVSDAGLYLVTGGAGIIDPKGR